MSVIGKPVRVGSSLIVKAEPRRVSGLSGDIERMPGAEVHGDDGLGNLVIAVEEDDDGALDGVMGAIRALPGVRLVRLVRHPSEAV